MCGILAVTSVSPVDGVLLRGGTDAQSHRGPDSGGTFVSDQKDCFLGHRRLAILDLSASGHQPMTDSRNTVVVAFNGEIYNFVDLKRELEASHGPIRWRSGTDTEVLAEGFALEGDDFFDRLNGIYALAAYHKASRTLVVLRDPIGVKPLYCASTRGSILFSSEVRGLLAVDRTLGEPRPQSIVDLLTYMYVPEPHTMYRPIQKVEPGVVLTYREGMLLGSRTLRGNFHEPLLLPLDSSLAELTEQFDCLLSQAVRRQLMSDVPLALLFSGGIDSSAIAYSAVKYNDKVVGYTIDTEESDRRFQDQDRDLSYAELVAKHVNLPLHRISVNRDILRDLPRLVGWSEGEFSDPAALNTYFICAAARERGTKVLLSGQGADEYLCGYRRYVAENALGHFPPTLLRLLGGLEPFLPRTVTGPVNRYLRRARKFLSSCHPQPADRLMNYFCWSKDDTLREIFRDYSGLEAGRDVKEFVNRENGRDPLRLMLEADRHFDLRSLNLCYTDKMSMASGVEVRVPFLDLELVRFMKSLPISALLSGKSTKHVLRLAMKDKLPTKVIQRSKSGFYLPVRGWLNRQEDLVMSYLSPTSLTSSGVFNPAAVDKMLRMHEGGKEDHTSELFTILWWQVWYSNRDKDTVGAHRAAS